MEKVMGHVIHTKTGREGLEARVNEPYWRVLKRGRAIGFRKIAAPTRGSWLARMRPAGGGAKYEYEVLGDTEKLPDYDGALEAAEKWFKLKAGGVKTDDIKTVADACRAYVKERRTSKSEACAHDADKRFERTVYDAHLGRVKLANLRIDHVREWRDGLELKPAAANRTLTALKAALNLHDDYVEPALLVKLRTKLKPLAGGKKRRDLYLDLTQRRALLKAATGAVRDLIEAAAITGARAGELVNATVAQYKAGDTAMTFIGKTGERTVLLSAAAVTLFDRLAEGKAPADRLLTRDDKKPWSHSDWDELVREAAKAAKLKAGTCLYTLRHSYITDAINAGNSTLAVARFVGTSVTMIDRFYGQKTDDSQKKLAQLVML
jgi:site-specific recombinase XerD